MARYTTVTISNYNLNPPSDDGTQSAANQLNWSTHKTKLGDPLKTAIEAIDTKLVTAFTDLVPDTTTAGSIAYFSSTDGDLAETTDWSISSGNLVGTGSILLNSTQSITFDADDNTGLQSSADDQLQVLIGGAVDVTFTANTLTFNTGTSVVFEGSSDSLDMNGNELVLDSDADTSITADTDDEIDFRIGGSDTVKIDSGGIRSLITSFGVHANTSDASDNAQISISGGGADDDDTRGGHITLHGNEHASTGKVEIKAGNVSGGTVDVYVAGAIDGQWSTSGLSIGKGTTANFDLDLDGQFSHLPPGSVFWLASATIPTNARLLACDGSAVSRTTYADLFANIGEVFGTGDGSFTFNLPDLRGEFIRGWDNSRGVDSGRSLGSFQDHQLEDHTHTEEGVDNDGQSGGTGSTRFIGQSQSTGGVQGANAGTETRPRNVALQAVIVY